MRIHDKKAQHGTVTDVSSTNSSVCQQRSVDHLLVTRHVVRSRGLNDQRATWLWFWYRQQKHRTFPSIASFASQAFWQRFLGKNEDVFPENGACNQAATWVSRSVSHRDALGCWLPRWCRLRKVTGPRCESADRSSLFHKRSHTERLQSRRHWQACLPSVIPRFRDNIHIISAETTCQVIDNQTGCRSE